MENLSLICIYSGGALSLFMGIFHTRFFRLFKWEDEFIKVSQINKKIFYTIHLALLLLFFGIAFISMFYAKELSLSNGLSSGFNLMYSLFWLWRTLWQIFYFKPDRNRQSLSIHYILTLYFFLLFVSYFTPVMLRLITGINS